MRTSMDRVTGTDERKRFNELFGGFSAAFIRLPKEEQEKILRDLSAIREESGNNRELLIARVQAYAAMYATMNDAVKREKEGSVGALTQCIGRIADVASQLHKVGQGGIPEGEFGLSR